LWLGSTANVAEADQPPACRGEHLDGVGSGCRGRTAGARRAARAEIRPRRAPSGPLGLESRLEWAVGGRRGTTRGTAGRRVPWRWLPTLAQGLSSTPESGAPPGGGPGNAKPCENRSIVVHAGRRSFGTQKIEVERG
jgi:hypothetical protein